MSRELYDLQAERQYLSAVWNSQGAVLEQSELTADDFVHTPHQVIFGVMGELRAAGAPLDPASVHRALGPDLNRCKSALLEVATAGALPQQAEWHAGTIMRLAAHRKVVEAGTRVVQAAEQDRDPEDLAEFARQEIDRATAPRGAAPVTAWSDYLDQALDRWTSDATPGLPTNWHDLDELLPGGGLSRGHLTVIGARPGVGKSLIATQLAAVAGAQRRGAVYFASAEMSGGEITDRIAAATTGVNLSMLTNRKLHGTELAKLITGLEQIRDWPLIVDDQVHTIPALQRGVRNATRHPAGLDLVVVDYVQLLEPADRSVPRQEQVSAMSRAMKLLAREHNVPVVMLAQLNRQAAGRTNKHPLITDLRESGSLEQDADEVILLHRDDEDADLAGQIQLHLAKNRHGATGHVRLAWRPYISRVDNMVLRAA